MVSQLMPKGETQGASAIKPPAIVMAMGGPANWPET